MSYTCIVVEGNPEHNSQISSYIDEHPNLILTDSFSEPLKARKYLLSNQIDIVFSDMDMPTMSGIEMVRSLPWQSYYIFITSSPNFAVESYEVNTGDYLIKPLSKEQFLYAVSKGLKKIQSTIEINEIKKIINLEKDFFVIRADLQYIKIKYSDILFLQAMEDFVRIQTKTDSFMPLLNLKFFEEQLPSNRFVKAHRSYLVNVENINTISLTSLSMDAYDIPLGKLFKEEIIKNFTQGKLLKK